MAATSSRQPVPLRGRLVSFLPWATAVTTLGAAAWARRGLPAVLPLDDAYITLHSAHALLAGGDRSYGSPVLSGITSAPHLLLVALAQVLAPGERSVLGLAWVGLALYAAGLVALARRAGAPPLWGALAVLCGLTAGMLLPYHAFNGLETGWGLAALSWALVLALPADGKAPAAAGAVGKAPAAAGASGRPRPSIGLGVLLGTLPFLRPELGVFTVVLLALRCLAARRSGGAELRRFSREALAALLAAAPWVAWYWLSTGSPFPSSALVKATFRAEGCLPWPARLGELRSGLAESLPGAAVLGAVFLALRGPRRNAAGFAGLAAAAAFFAAATALFPFAPQMQEGRYTVVFVPLCVLGFILALRTEHAVLRRLAQGLLILAVAYDLARWPAAFAAEREAKAFTAGELADTARWLDGHLPAGARLLVHDAGYVAEATPFALVDAVGLKTPASAELHRRLTASACGAGRGDALAAIAAQSRVTHLVVLAEWEQRFGFTQELAQHGWTVTRLRDGHTGYSVYALAPPR